MMKSKTLFSFNRPQGPRGLGAALALTMAGWAAPAFAASQPQPNILVILADDQGWNDVSWHNPAVHTPNLERYCRDSLQLNQQYVLPMCSPTRATLLSGRFASRFGVSEAQNERAFPYDTVTLAGALKTVGYDTALIGKWHLGSAPDWGPQKFGFDYSYGTLAGGCGPYSHAYKAGPYEKSWHRNGVLISEEGHVTDLITQEAVKYLGQKHEKPFFLYVPYTAPHVPIQEPNNYLDLNGVFTVPAKREYYSSVAHLDWGVGEIMAALEKSGQRDNTVVLFLSDNGAIPNQPNQSWLVSKDPREQFVSGPGGGSNDPLRGQKTTVYEGGIRVPAFVRWPGHLKPGQFDGPLHAADWMPTFCALAGYKPKTDLKWDGRNVWPLLTGAEKVAPRELYWVSPNFTQYAARTGDWKLVVTKKDDRAELFDLKTDPNEKTDLAAKQPERVKAMRDLIAKFAAHDNENKVEDAGPKEKEAMFVPDDDNYPMPGYLRPELAYSPVK